MAKREKKYAKVTGNLGCVKRCDTYAFGPHNKEKLKQTTGRTVGTL